LESTECEKEEEFASSQTWLVFDGKVYAREAAKYQAEANSSEGGHLEPGGCHRGEHDGIEDGDCNNKELKDTHQAHPPRNSTLRFRDEWLGIVYLDNRGHILLLLLLLA
jgi:hypothetical protein